MAMPTVLVRGSAVVSATPDEVEMVLQISALRKTPSEALTEVSQRSKALEKLLDELKIPSGKRSTSGVSVQEQWEYDKQHNRRHTGFKAHNRVSVRVKDVKMVGRLMNEATEKAQAQISGPWWRVALDNPARTRACEEAAAEARRKAEAYAKALGARVGAVVGVTEPGLRDEYYERPRLYSVEAMADAQPEIRVEAGELDVSASVEVEFRIEQGQ